MGCIQSCFKSNNRVPAGQRCCRPLKCCATMPIQPERKCKVTGCTYMDNGHLVIVDFNNKRVKLYTLELKCCSFLALEFRPLDVCAVGNSVYITMPKHKLVQKINVTIPMLFVKRKLIPRSTFPTEAECKAIAAYKGDLIISVNFKTHADTRITDSSWQVHIVSTSGVVKRRIAHNSEGLLLFQDARFICLTPDHKELVIAEAEDNRVKCLNIERGELTFNQHMEDPKGVICDKEGNIYVLGKNGAIRWILFDRSVVKSLLHGTPNVKYSDCITYSETANTLAVPRNENKVDLFRLKKSILDD